MVLVKSTLLETIPGLVKPIKGELFWKSKSFQAIRKKERAKKIGYLPQFHYAPEG